MRTLEKGRATEAAVLKAFADQDFPVLLPFGDGQPYDLVVHLPTDAFLRVQCKTARPVEGGFIFNSRSTDHGRGAQSYLGLADVFGIYFPENERVYLVPVSAVCGLSCGKAILRLKPPRNNQRRGIRLAGDFEIGRWSREALCALTGTARFARRQAPQTGSVLTAAVLPPESEHLPVETSAILALLGSGGRFTTAEVASSIGVSRVTARERLKQLSEADLVVWEQRTSRGYPAWRLRDSQLILSDKAQVA